MLHSTVIALSISGGIKTLGAYAGLAAMVALALLALLYFAQARELKRLSEWVTREGQRPRAPGPPPTPPPQAAPAPAMVPRAQGGAPPIAASVEGVRRVPLQGVAGATTGVVQPAGAPRSATPDATTISEASAAEQSPPPVDAVATPRLVAERVPGQEAGSVHEIGDGMTLGRAKSASVRLADPMASAQHARVAPGGGRIVISDLGSTNGTFLNGVRLSEPATLSGGDRIRLGESEFVFVAPSTAPPDATPTADAPSQQSSTAADGPAADGPATDALAIDGLSADAPATDALAIDALSADAPATDALATDAPATGAAARDLGGDLDPEAAANEDAPPRSPAVPLMAAPVEEREVELAEGAIEGPPRLPPPPKLPPPPQPPPAPHPDSPTAAAPGSDKRRMAAITRRRRGTAREGVGTAGGHWSPQAGRRRLLMLAIAVAIAVVVIVVVVIAGGGGSGPSRSAGTQSTTGSAAAPAPATITVAVLNATDRNGLAHSVSQKLVRAGFARGAIADAPSPATLTTVAYTKGSRAAATEVARALHVVAARTVPVTSATAASASSNGASPQVVVTVGADYGP